MIWKFITEFISDISYNGTPSRSNSTNIPSIMKPKLNYNVFLAISKSIISVGDG